MIVFANSPRRKWVGRHARQEKIVDPYLDISKIEEKWRIRFERKELLFSQTEAGKHLIR
jgi:hypothetical protein